MEAPRERTAEAKTGETPWFTYRISGKFSPHIKVRMRSVRMAFVSKCSLFSEELIELNPACKGKTTKFESREQSFF
jgi:hypothetical protein